MNIFNSIIAYNYSGETMLIPFLLVVGYIFTLIGFTYVIGYLNLLQIGYKTIDYVNFIIRRVECLCLILGIAMLITGILLMRKGD